MRGSDGRTGSLFSYVDLEDRVPAKHPLRLIRGIVDDVLAALDAEFGKIYAAGGRPSIPPERLLRALLLQAFYTIRSETQLMEHARAQRDAAYRAEYQRTAFCDRQPHHAASWIRGEPAEKKAHRGAVRLGQDDRRACAADAARRRKAPLQVHPDDGRLQSDPPAKAACGMNDNTSETA